MFSLSQDKLKTILSAVRNKTVIVIGDVMIDEYLWGNVQRLSPEAPVPIVEIEKESLRFGGAANVALNLKMLGANPIPVGLIGNDRMGETFLSLLKEYDISDAGIIVSNERPTTVKTRIIGGNQHLARVDRETSDYISDSLEWQVIERFGQLLSEANAVIYEDYNKGILPINIIHKTIKLAGKNNILTTVDPKFVNFMEYRNVALFKPNLKELSRALARVIDGWQEVEEAGFELRRRLDVDYLLLTMGAQGMALFGRENTSMIHIPTKTRKVADVSGAGDTVISTMTAALVGGASYEDAAHLSNYAAGIVCEEVGIVPISAEILLREIYHREAV